MAEAEAGGTGPWDPEAVDLFAAGAPAGCGGGAEVDDSDDSWEVVRWAPADNDMPEVQIHRHLAQCWASARMLAEWLLGPGRPLAAGCGLVVELGASLGLPTLAASAAGAARCVATDLYPSGSAEAMEATIARNRRCTGNDGHFQNVTAQRLNWFEAPTCLGALLGAAGLALCADVIYERRAAPAIACAAEAVLRPGGTLVFASRYGRVGLDEFLEVATAPRGQGGGCGLLLRSEAPLRSEALGLGLSDEDAHGLWVFEKPPATE